MNFYKHHIGDYAQATAHLSFVEDAAYSRLLRKYYVDERPLPCELKAVQRLIGARTREEREAVQTVLSEFFNLLEDGWHNKRCDQELEKAGAQADTNRRIAEERETKRRERIAHEQSTNRPIDRDTNRSTVGQPSQTPDTRHQTPDTRLKDTRSPPSTDSGSENQRVSMAGAVCIALKAEGIASVNPGHPDLTALLDAGAEVQNFVSAARVAVPKGKGFAYVLGIVKGQLIDAAALAASGVTAANSTTARHGSSGSHMRAARMAEANPHLVQQPHASVIDMEVADVTAIKLG